MWMWLSAYLAIGVVVAGFASSSGILDRPWAPVVAGFLWPIAVLWFLLLMLMLVLKA